MLVFPVVCKTCGSQIGAQSLLYVHLRNQRFGARPDQYAAVDFKEISAMVGLQPGHDDCCWQQLHSTLSLADLRLGIRLVTSDGVPI